MAHSCPYRVALPAPPSCLTSAPPRCTLAAGATPTGSAACHNSGTQQVPNNWPIEGLTVELDALREIHSSPCGPGPAQPATVPHHVIHSRCVDGWGAEGPISTSTVQRSHSESWWNRDTDQDIRSGPGDVREWTRGRREVRPCPALPCPVLPGRGAHRIHQGKLLCHQVGREGQEVRLLIQAIFCSHR